MNAHLPSRPGSPALARLLQSARELLPGDTLEPPLSVLAARFQEFSETGEQPLCVAVLRLADDPAVARVFFTEERLFELCQRAALRNGGLVEVKLGRQGFALDEGDRHHDFVSCEKLMGALEQAVAREAEPGNTLRIVATSPTEGAEMNLLIPESLAAVGKAPAMASELAARADFLVVGGPPEAALPPEGAAAIEDMLQTIPSLQCLVSGGEAGSPVPWAQSLPATLKLPLLHLTPGSAIPPFLGENKQGARALAQEYRRVRETGRLIEELRAAMVAECGHLQSERAACEARHAASASNVDAANEVRRFGESCLQMLNEDFSLLTRHREDATRDLMLPRGTFYDLIRRIPESLGEKDLLFTDENKVTRLRARDEAVSELQQRILRRLFRDFESEAALVSETVLATVEELNKRLAQAQPGLDPLRHQPFDPSRLLDFAGTVCTAPVQFKGEIPRITAGAFLWQTVQHPVMIIFTLMMPAQMFAAQRDVANHLREWRFDVALYGLLPLYVITPFYLHKKLSGERKNVLERELDRYRQTVQGELDRSVRMALEEKKRLVSEYLRATLDDLRRQAADRVQQVAQARERKRQTDRTEGAATLQRIDARVKDLSARAQQCDKLKVEIETVRRAVETSWNPLG